MNELSFVEQLLIKGVLGVALVALIYAVWLWRDTLRSEKGTPKMIEVWTAIKRGAEGYLRRQLKTILIVLLSLTVVLFLSVYIIPPSKEAVDRFGENATLVVAIGRTLAFIVGAAFSTLVGQLGMRVAIEGNVRVAAQAVKGEYNKALTVAYRAGTFTGMLTDGLGLLGGTAIFMIFGKAAPDALLGFGFGGTLVALFMRIGGGIYTKAADVGADLVGKVEEGLPEDDPRNAGVVADLVGDNVGDCAGRGADLFESTAAENIGAMILGVAVYGIAVTAGWPNPESWIFFPLVVRAFGLLATIVAMFFVGGLALTTWAMMDTAGTPGNLGIPVWVWFFFPGLVGLATSVVFVYITQYY